MIDTIATTNDLTTLSLVGAYFGGLLSSLTPCVYPVIPITLSIVGARGAKTRREAFGHAGLYVAGMTITYTILGIISARTGALFGAFFQRPVFIVPFAVLLVILACSELDIVTIKLFSRAQQAAQKVGGGGSRIAIFFMGSASGLVAAPCIGPVLALVLSVAASSGSSFWGGALLFAYSAGMGTLFLLLGTFAPLLQRLPRSGRWLQVVKCILAISLLVVALLFVGRWVPRISFPLWANLSLVVGSLLVISGSYKAPSRSLRLFGSVVCATTVFLSIRAPSSDADSFNNEQTIPLQWIDSFQEAQRLAQSSGKPLFVDFFAEWCGACKQIDSVTLADASVREELSRHWVITRVDLTTDSPEGEALQHQYGIKGLPTLLFFVGGNTAPHPTRLTEFLAPAALRETLITIRSNPGNVSGSQRALE